MGRNHVTAKSNLSQNRDCAADLWIFLFAVDHPLYFTQCTYCTSVIGLAICQMFCSPYFSVSPDDVSGGKYLQLLKLFFFFRCGVASMITKLFLSFCCCYSSASFFKETVSWYGIFLWVSSSSVFKKSFQRHFGLICENLLSVTLTACHWMTK